MKKNIYKAVLLALMMPLFTFAAGQTLDGLTSTIVKYLNQSLVILMGVALVVFVWNIIKYFVKGNEDHKEAAPYVMWSIIGFFVILSVWGLVNILKNTVFGGTDTSAPSWSSFDNIFPSGSGGGNSQGSLNGL